MLKFLSIYIEFKEILNAEEIDGKTFESHCAEVHQTEKQKYEIERFKIKSKNLGLNDLDDSLLEIYLNKESKILASATMLNTRKFIEMHTIDTFDEKTIQQKIDIFEQIQQSLNFEYADSKEYTVPEFEKALKSVEKTVTSENAIFLFELSRQNIENVFHKVTAILRHFGVSIKKTYAKGKRKIVDNLSSYILEHDKDIIEIVSLMNYYEKISVKGSIKDTLERYDKHYPKFDESMSEEDLEDSNDSSNSDDTDYSDYSDIAEEKPVKKFVNLFKLVR